MRSKTPLTKLTASTATAAPLVAGAEPLCHLAKEAAGCAGARLAGNFNTTAFIAGNAVDLIGNISHAAAVFERMAHEAGSRFSGASIRYRVAATSSATEVA